ncbi:MAG: glycosyltransferase family 4 protein, partial [Alphaproteobacteria bacterium]|nr:glycosyltransferase family 4 protein [Alphaproteobacteria bacterium]
HLGREDRLSAFAFLHEARRRAPLPPEDERLWADLRPAAEADPGLAGYLATVGPGRELPRRPPRRVLLVTNLFPPEEMGGYGRKLWEFARALSRRGYPLRVLTGSAPYLRQPGDEDLEPIVSRALRPFAEWRDGGSRPMDDPDAIGAAMLRNEQAVLDAVRAFEPEVVLAGNLDFLGTGFLAALYARGLPVLHAIGLRAFAYRPGDLPVHPRLYRAAPASDWLGRMAVADGFPFERWSVLHPGVRTDRFHRLVPPEAGPLRIAYAGLVMPFKGVHTLLDALGRLHDRGMDFRCAIAGDAPDAEYNALLADFVRCKGMADKVRFTGFMDRAGLERLFDTHDVFVFPSVIEEAFGMSQVEAMAAGLACVTTATGGGREIVADGETALLFEPGDAETLAVILARLHGDPDLRQRLSRAGRTRALDFSVERAADALESLIDEMARIGAAER